MPSVEGISAVHGREEVKKLCEQMLAEFVQEQRPWAQAEVRA